MFRIKYEQNIEKDLKYLPKKVIKQVLDRIEFVLCREPFSGQKLEHRGKSFYKYRVRDYRVIYTIDVPGREIGIYRIRHRKEVYRDL